MNSQPPQNAVFPDKETLDAWENMRIEVLHELQEGASADIPDRVLEEIGTLIVTLRCLRTQRKVRLSKTFTRSKGKLSTPFN